MTASCVDLLIFQATRFCNINCSYCYLPNRLDTERIFPETVSTAIGRLIEAGMIGKGISIVWHAGEPLAVGPAYLRQLINACSPLEAVTRVQHFVQTNATLIDSRFCDLFKEKAVRIGVSIDGPRDLHDRHRVTRAGKGTFDSAMRGIATLRESEIGFDAICVLTAHSLDRPAEIYEFFSRLGASTVGFNVDELEGANRSSSMESDRFFERLAIFWEEIMRVHFARKAFWLREVDGLVETLRRGSPGEAGNVLNPFAIVTVATNGATGTFSPELLGQWDSRYGDFSIGNIHSEGISRMVTGMRFLKMKEEIEAGVRKCSQQCSYFEICGGGTPSNKISEHGTFNVTETRHCRATKMIIVDSLLKVAREHQAWPVPA